MTDRPRRPPAARSSAAPPAAWSVGVALALFALGLAMTPPVAGDKDAAEFTLVLATLGLAHPTGYPLYTFAGHAFVSALHALGAGWDWAANAWSGVGGAVAAGLLHALAARLLVRQGVRAGRAALVALAPAVAFGLNPAWTIETTLAEVNSWHVAWVAGAALALAAAVPALERPDDGHDARRFAALGLLAGMGLAHHATSVFVVAPAAVAVLFAAARAGRLRAAPVALAALAALLPLASYSYVFWRADHPARVQWASLGPGWRSAWHHVTGREYTLFLGRFAPSERQRRLLASYVWPWLPLALAGAGAWAVRGRGAGPARAAIAAAVALQTAYAFVYGVPDPSCYFLPPLALGLAATPAALATWPAARARGAWLGAAAALGLAFASVAWVRRGVERAGEYQVFDVLLRRMWNSVPFDRGFVIWQDDMVQRLREFQILDGERPGLEVLHPVMLTYDAPHQAFIRRHGFDPTDPARIDPRLRAAHPGDVTALAQAVGDAVTDEINARSPLPVVVFLPQVPSVRLLRKPGADSTAAAPPEPSVIH